MSNTLFIEDTTLTAIADSIRAKLGVATQFSPLDMPEAIDDIETGGETPLVPPTSDRDYLYFQAEEPNATVSFSIPSSWTCTFEYSTNGSSWQDWLCPTIQNSRKYFDTITLPYRGAFVFIRAKTTNNPTTGTTNWQFDLGTKKISAGGNIMSMLSNNLSTTSIQKTYQFYALFNGCSFLTTPPKLPATTLQSYCYQYMFSNCVSLKSSPDLPATAITSYGYSYMFTGCISLKNTGTISATSVSSYSCEYMFNGCKSLVNAPDISHITSLNTYCFQYMFYNCTSLATPPQLPATTLTSYCYNSMFSGCTALTTAPELPATTLASYCYQYMFNNCYSLTTAPIILPATTLASYCYRYMFYNCTSLTTAPELPATTLTSYCYQYMFYNCSSLNRVGCNISSANTTHTNSWLYGVSPTGTFTKNALCSNWSRNASGIPSGWTVNDYIDYFYLENQSSGATTLTITITGSNPTTNDLAYSLDKNTWTSVNLSQSSTTVSVPALDKIYLRSSTGLSSSTGTITIKLNNNFITGGNILTLINYTNSGSASYSAYCFSHLFDGASTLVTAPSLPNKTLAQNCFEYMFKDCTALTSTTTLSATSLTQECYKGMFKGCTALTISPTLPATTLATSCYQEMFSGCIALTTVNTLPATTLATYCYKEMFCNCTALTTAPGLSASTLQEGCYMGMFKDCTALTSTPSLMANTLVSYCYKEMFYNCSNLATISCYAEQTALGAIDCTYNWAYNVAQTGTFKCKDHTLFTIDSPSGIPIGWTYQESSLFWVESANPFYMVYVTDSFSDYYEYDTWARDDYIANYTYNINIEYSTDAGSTWQTLTSSAQGTDYYRYEEGWGSSRYYFAVNTPYIYIPANTKVFLRGDISNSNPEVFYGDMNYWPGSSESLDYAEYLHTGLYFLNRGYLIDDVWAGSYVDSSRLVEVSCGGDITSLLNGVGGDVSLNSDCFAFFLAGQKITTAPALPSTTLYEYCYWGMFSACTLLTVAPNLPATTLQYYCYSGMFYYCTSLTTAPELPATTLVSGCYYQMFSSCTLLNYIKVGATSWNTNYTINWVYEVSATGNFYKPTNTSITTGYSGIPSGWTVHNE